MQIQLATQKNLPEIMEVIEDGRAFLKRQGLPQWQNGYGPSEAQMAEDIANQFCFIAILKGKIVAVASLIRGVDPVYSEITGAWSYEDEIGYIAIHRVAVSRDFTKQGIARQFLTALIKVAQEQGYKDIRIDTYPDNKPMIKTIEALGFFYCGQVHFPIPAGVRNAYQLVLA